MMISNYNFNAISSCSLYMHSNVFHFRYCCYVTHTHMQCKILPRNIVKRVMVDSISLIVVGDEQNMHNFVRQCVHNLRIIDSTKLNE